VTWLLALIQSLLARIPFIGTFLSSGVGDFIKEFYDSKTAIETARLGGAKDVAIAAMQTRVSGLGVIAGSTALTLLVFLFAIPLVGFTWKVVMWDVVIGAFQGCSGQASKLARCALFSTDPIHGQVAEWATTIIACLFGSLGGLTLASVFRKGR
jgi:hypothetical protein